MNHSFNIEYAQKYGIEEAILIENFIFWISKNKANRKHDREIEIDGAIVVRTFTYNSATALAELFPYMTVNTLRRVTQRLCDLKVLAKGVFNTNSYDRTTWFCFVDENAFLYNAKSILQNCEMEVDKKQNGIEESPKSLYSYKPVVTTDINEKEKIVYETPKEEEKDLPHIESLTEKLQKLCKEKGITYTEKLRNDNEFWKGKVSFEMSKTDEQILEQAHKFAYLFSNVKEFRPGFLDEAFGYELLYKKWNDITTRHLKLKPMSKPILAKKSPVIESSQSTEDFMKDLEELKNAS